jgi:hypothetical protein
MLGLAENLYEACEEALQDTFEKKVVIICF